MPKFWNLLNGKKTNIGASALLVSAVLRQTAAIWGFEAASWIGPVCDTLDYLGGVLAGVGLGHKAVK